MSSTPITQVEYLDPKQLLTDSNVRRDLALDKEFVASIRMHGVLVPISAVRTAEGALRVRFGNRRTAAAIEAELVSVPVVVLGEEGSDDAAQIERLLTQRAENTDRAGMTEGEQVSVTSQLAAFGLSAAQIAKRTQTKRAVVDAALSVTASPLAQGAMQRYDFLTLEHASVLAEFEHNTEAVKALVAAAKDGPFAHVAQQLRDDRDEAALVAQFAATLTEQGIRVVKAPGYDDKTARRLRELHGQDGKELSVESHQGCPGAVAWVQVRRLPGDKGKLSREASAAYGCENPRKHGHRAAFSYGAPVRQLAADMSPQEREKASAQRKTTIANNKAWGSAEVVRRDWLRTFAQRATAPKDAAAFIATSMASCDHALTQAMSSGHQLGRELLGLDERAADGRRAALGTTTPGRSLMVTLVLMLAAYEQGTSTESWRQADRGTARYLSYLKDTGYVLSDVELLAMKAKK